METIKINLFSFAELSPAARRKALTAFNDLNTCFDWWDFEFDDFIALCATIGITVYKESIRFRGFYSQGDGSGFSASADLCRLNEAIRAKAWKAYAPNLDFGLSETTADRRVMALLKNGLLEQNPRIVCRTRSYGVTADLGVYGSNENGKSHDRVFEELDRLEGWLLQVATKLNNHLYKSLEKQFDYLVSEEAVAEGIVANGYLFTIDGQPANHLKQLSENINA